MASEKESSSSSQNSPEHRGLLYILLSALAFLFGWSLSKLKTPIQEPIETIYPQDNTSNARQTGQNISPPPTRVIIDAFPPKPSPTKEQNARKRRKEILRVLTYIFQGAAVLIAFGLLCVTSRYTEYARQQRDQMIRQNEIAHDAMVRSQRAWVGPSQPIQVGFYNLGPPEMILQYRLFLKNFGPTVALDVVQDVGAAPSHEKLDEAMDASCHLAEKLFKNQFMTKPPPGGKLGQTIFPNEERRIPVEDSGPSDTKLTTLYIVGCVFYRDQFKTDRRTRFCFETPGLAKDFMPSSQKLVYCNVYNDAE